MLSYTNSWFGLVSFLMTYQPSWVIQCQSHPQRRTTEARLQFWSNGVYRVPFHSYYSQVHYKEYLFLITVWAPSKGQINMFENCIISFVFDRNTCTSYRTKYGTGWNRNFKIHLQKIKFSYSPSSTRH